MKRFMGILVLLVFGAAAQAGEVVNVGGHEVGVSGSISNNGTNANVYFDGSILTESVHAGLWTSASTDPQPGNIGTFTMVISASGNWVEDGDPITNEMWNLSDNPISSNASIRTTNINTYEDDEMIWINFDEVLGLNSGIMSGFQIDLESEKNNINGWISGNFNVYGGRITGVEPIFQDYTGTEGGPFEGMPDYNAYATVTGIITSENFRVVVPEPATLVMLGLGGVGTVWRKRRRLA